MNFTLIHDPIYQSHETGMHPERTGRWTAIDQAIQQAKLAEKVSIQPPVVASLDSIGKIHSAGMIERVLETAREGGGYLDSDTVVSKESAEVALRAAGAGIEAIRLLNLNNTRRAMGIVRPPGHHATPFHSMGFCLFNNIAVAAETLLESDDIDRVAILDFDVHHGNGTQDIFYERGDVLFVSWHQSPHYPGTGARHEQGKGEGLGKTINYPLPGGVILEKWMDCFQRGLDAVSDFSPQAILVSAGFDGHRLDPLGDFPLTEEAFHSIGAKISELAADRPLISLLEGGYNLEVLGRSVVAYIQAQL